MTEQGRAKGCVKSPSRCLESSSSPQIPLGEVAVLFRCGRCQVAPIQPPVYTCQSGHLTCSLCVRRFDRDCHKCRRPFVGRNHLLEEVVRSLSIQTCVALSHCKVLRETRSEQDLRSEHLSLQDPSHLVKLESARLEAQAEEEYNHRGDSLSGLSTLHQWASHRPIMCPYPCGRIMTCTGLIAHFQFHHPQVLITTVTKEVSSMIGIQYEQVAREESLCHVFFVVRLDDGLSSRATAADLIKMTRSSQELLRKGCFISTLTVGRINDPRASGDDTWFLLIWATCIYDVSPVTYTISVCIDSPPHTVSFTGPMVSLHESQRPVDVCKRGDCLLISSGLLRKMNFGPNPLKLLVTYHSSISSPLKLQDSIETPSSDNIFS